MTSLKKNKHTKYSIREKKKKIYRNCFGHEFSFSSISHTATRNVSCFIISLYVFESPDVRS